jgi:hypothetical protein
MIDDFGEIPDEVLFELMDQDGFRNEGPQFDYDLPKPRPTHRSLKYITKCAICGCQGLALADTEFGERLVYEMAPKSMAFLIGKIHECEDSYIRSDV